MTQKLSISTDCTEIVATIQNAYVLDRAHLSRVGEGNSREYYSSSERQRVEKLQLLNPNPITIFS